MTSSEQTHIDAEQFELLRRSNMKVVEGGHDGAGLRIPRRRYH